MKQKIPMPVIIVAIVALIAAVAFFGSKAMAPPPALSEADTKLPDFIDPVTKKPKAGVASSSGGNRPSNRPSFGGSTAPSGGQ